MIDTSLYSSHIPVMLEQCMALMDPQPGGSYADGTLGAGGHSEAILKASEPDGKLLAFDLDPTAIAIATERLKSYGDRVRIIHDSYVNLGNYTEENSLDGFIVDLGVSSMQLDRQERGFSFLQDGPLDMRFSPEQTLTAADIVNEWPEEDLAEILWKYGEERKSRQIAAMICAERKNTRINTTGQLEAVIRDAVGSGREKIHPATRSFQAIRIAVNGELDAVEAVLPAAVKSLKPGGRLLVISFHSLEDRIVKNFLKKESKDCLCPPEQLICTCGHKASLKELTRHPITADEDEIRCNTRSRSAKLRAAVKR
ncbi:MAG: 16S rRNA (cytosine(1402)-N(4))-methyltransferase RsmH [Anaerolineaceae bacterium]|nr:16S rRNA (cytosine(1402)-N(4))-methyltransferase RsmH [Anaerolineaceae bacterium]